MLITMAISKISYMAKLRKCPKETKQSIITKNILYLMSWVYGSIVHVLLSCCVMDLLVKFYF